ncbi:T9SS type A sorting domain-containing protein [uncultured Chryseobacterium sp.]|uniref:T9SS type A sorting domain-containing protein n=1 Tax=uncultured Chryseobacterium sp. TaxID=259322 RepID=UPI0025D9504B|nr:T9SS type A sorting domain-containing protein [uncultured Chryseobacterium sp.]
MKKLISIFFILVFSSSIYAGWSTSERKNCKWWNKKYHATARVFTGLFASQTTGNCGYAYAEKIKNCAWQKASRGDNGVWAQGGVNKRICSRGEVITLFDEFFLPQTDEAEETIEESEIKAAPSIFDEDSHAVAIPNINGKIRLKKNNGFYSDLRFSIWKPTDDTVNFIEDETMDDSEILHQITVKVTDNGLIFKGELVTEEIKSKFEVVNTGDEIYVVITGLTLKFPVDQSISLDEVSVQIEGDGAPDTKANAAKMSANTDLAVAKNEYQFNVYPNPTSDFITIDFSNNLSEGNTNIQIYNFSGKKVKDVYNGQVNRGNSKSLKIDLSSLPKGEYFILIDSNGKRLSKKIIKD